MARRAVECVARKLNPKSAHVCRNLAASSCLGVLHLSSLCWIRISMRLRTILSLVFAVGAVLSVASAEVLSCEEDPENLLSITQLLDGAGDWLVDELVIVDGHAQSMDDRTDAFILQVRSCTEFQRIGCIFTVFHVSFEVGVIAPSRDMM
jgi:hypothetical protein